MRPRAAWIDRRGVDVRVERDRLAAALTFQRADHAGTSSISTFRRDEARHASQRRGIDVESIDAEPDATHHAGDFLLRRGFVADRTRDLDQLLQQVPIGRDELVDGVVKTTFVVLARVAHATSPKPSMAVRLSQAAESFCFTRRWLFGMVATRTTSSRCERMSDSA